MTDTELVERLRKRREAEFLGGYERIEWEDEDALEAADRIEALQSALTRSQEQAEALAGALNDAEEALSHLDEGALGFVEVQTGEDDGCFIYPLRDELLAKVHAALAAYGAAR